MPTTLAVVILYVYWETRINWSNTEIIMSYKLNIIIDNHTFNIFLNDKHIYIERDHCGFAINNFFNDDFFAPHKTYYCKEFYEWFDKEIINYKNLYEEILLKVKNYQNLL